MHRGFVRAALEHPVPVYRHTHEHIHLYIHTYIHAYIQKGFIRAVLEHPLRVLAVCSHVNALMWVRNGFTALNQVRLSMYACVRLRMYVCMHVAQYTYGSGLGELCTKAYGILTCRYDECPRIFGSRPGKLHMYACSCICIWVCVG